MSIRTASPTSRSTRSARACRGRPPGARSVAPLAAGRRRAASSAGASSSIRRARRLGLPPLAHVHGGISASCALVATFPQLEYPRAWPAHVHVVGPLMWEPPADGRRAAAGRRRRSCSSRPRPPRTPSTGCCAPRCAGSPTRRCACSRPGTGGCPSRPLPVSRRTRGSSTGSPTRARCPAARRRLPRRPRHARARARMRLRRRGLPRRRRHERERRARSTGRARACALPRRFATPRVLRLAVERALGERAIRERAGQIAAWADAHDSGETAARLVEQLAA